MTGYSILDNPTPEPLQDLSGWADQYKERHISALHDQSMLTLATPDDAIIIAGPPRLAGGIDTDLGGFYVIGFVNMFQYSEQSQVQPLKALGSKRHIFSKTNTPVNGSIGKMLTLGPNLLRALYSNIDTDGLGEFNKKYSGNADDDSSIWYSNLEEDIFRVPFGLGVIYPTPGTQAISGTDFIGAEYFEATVIINRSISIQSGQTMIMENVSFMADRVIPLTSYSTNASAWNANNLLGEI